ncbi:MAG TPA: ABC transporter permease [Gemmataceae bacterium]
MKYALATLWHDRQRYLPGVLAVAFSAVLIALQCGLLLGLFAITSLPIDRTSADIWVGSPQVLSVDLGEPIPESFLSRVAAVPGVEETEFYYQAFATWTNADGGSDKCMIIGSRLEPGSMGLLDALTPELRDRLTEPNSVVIDVSDLDRLGVKGVGDTAHINRRPVRIVGLVSGVRGLAASYVFCSEPTARTLLRHHLGPERTIYILARCSSPERAEQVVRELRAAYPDDMAVYTSREFSLRSRLHWLTKTKAGIALGYAALLGLLVGLVVTSQTLFAATTAAAREYAILLALGIPRWRVSMAVIAQSFWVGLAGMGTAFPAMFLIAQGADTLGAQVRLEPWLLASTAAITMTMAVVSGLFALRSVRQIEPMQLLR